MTDHHQPEDHDPDRGLLSRVAEGDVESFGALVERHEARIFRLCERMLQNPEEARDAAQEVFLKAFRKAGSYRPRGKVYTWLYRIAVNHCLNVLRRRKLARFLSFGELGASAGVEDDSAPEYEPEAGEPDPEQRLEARQRWRATRELIDRLPASQRGGAGSGQIRGAVLPADRRGAGDFRGCGRESTLPRHAKAERSARNVALACYRIGRIAMTATTTTQQRQWMRLLHGELPADEARRLEAELARDDELRAAYEGLTRAWNGLELPAVEVPAGFSAGVTAAARKLQGGELSWSLAPSWARGGAVAALLGGLVLGAAFGNGLGAPAAGETVETALVADADAGSALSLAEVYWLSLDESGGQLTAAEAEGTP